MAKSYGQKVAFKLTPFLREELEHYVEHNRSMASGDDDSISEEDRPAFAATADAFEAVLTGKELTNEQRETLIEDLNHESDRYEGKLLREWENLMAYCGALDVFNPASQYFPRKPKTRVIGGVCYIVGK